MVGFRFLSLIALSTVVDYIVGLRIHSSGDNKLKAKKWLWVSIVFNLGLLGFFKYNGNGHFTDKFGQELIAQFLEDKSYYEKKVQVSNCVLPSRWLPL